MEFTIEFETDHLIRSLAAVRREVGHPQHVLHNVGEALLRVNRARQEAEKAPDGTPWKPLSPLTLKRKKSRSKMLVEHGDLLRTGFCYQVHGDTLTIGTSDRKGKFHQFGVRPHDTKRGHHPGMPARRFVGFPENDKWLASEVLRDHLDRVIDRARGRI